MEQLATSPKILGKIIRRQRKLKNLNQKEAGSLFNLTQRTVSSIEQGAPGTHIGTLFRLLSALDLELIIRSKNEIIKPFEEKEYW